MSEVYNVFQYSLKVCCRWHQYVDSMSDFHILLRQGILHEKHVVLVCFFIFIETESTLMCFFI